MAEKEILKSHFTETEYTRVESEIAKDTNFKEIYERIKNTPDYRLNKLEERVEKTEETFEIRFQAFKDAVLEAEKKQSKGVEDLAKNELEKKKEELMKDLKEKANQKVPFIGSYLFETASGLLKEPESSDKGFFKNIFSKFTNHIGLVILSLLGLEEGYDKYKNMKLPETITGSHIPSLIEQAKQPLKQDEQKIEKPEKTDNLPKSPEEPKKTEILEKKEDFYYFSGMNIVSYFSGNKSDSSKEVFTLLKQKTYKELESTNKEDILSTEDLKNSGKVDNFEKTKKALLNNDSKKILKASLSEYKVRKIIEKNGDTIGKENTEKIKVLLNSGKYNYEDLTFEQISILLLTGINTLKLLGIEGISEQFSNFTDFLGDSSSIDFKGIEKELIGKRQGLISDNLWKMFSKMGLSDFGGKMYMEKGEGDISLLRDFTEYNKGKEVSEEYIRDKIQLEELINFKNWLLDGFLLENKTLLNELGYKGDFKDALDYRAVNILYILLAGKQSLDNISTLDLPFLYTIIGKIINLNFPGRGSGYISKAGKYLLEGDEKNIFSKEEKEALSIVGEKLVISRLDISIDGLKKTLGYVGLFDGNIAVSTAVTLAGLGTFKYLGKVIPQFRLAGILTSVIGGLSLFSDLYGKGSELKKDLEGIFDFGKGDKKEIDIEDYIHKVEKIQNQLTSKEIEINGKKEKVVFYNGDKGLEVVYKNSIYRLDVGPDPLDKDIDLTNIWDQLPEKAASSTYDNFNGKDIEFSKTKLSGDNIIIGEGQGSSYNLSIQKVVDSLIENKVLYPKKLGSEEEYKPQEYLIVEKAKIDEQESILPEWTPDIIKDGEDYIRDRVKKDLVLMKVGEIKKGS